MFQILTTPVNACDKFFNLDCSEVSRLFLKLCIALFEGKVCSLPGKMKRQNGHKSRKSKLLSNIHTFGIPCENFKRFHWLEEPAYERVIQSVYRRLTTISCEKRDSQAKYSNKLIIFVFFSLFLFQILGHM